MDKLAKLLSDLIRRLGGQKGGKISGGHGDETLIPTEKMLDLAKKALDEVKKAKSKKK